jgi:tripartite-type tricarboxylate transporter receptor subunit TctC
VSPIEQAKLVISYSVLAAQDLIDRLAGQGAEVAPSTPEQLGKLVTEDLIRWAKIVKDSGATID